MEPIYIKLIASFVAGILALAICKAQDMFYNYQYTKTEYIASFTVAFVTAFVSLYVFEFFTAKFLTTTTQLGGAISEMKLPGTTPNTAQFKYNTGIPTF
jgi:fructose-specific phosphotransferase system IIC component